jgi:hypothetical protein
MSTNHVRPLERTGLPVRRGTIQSSAAMNRLKRNPYATPFVWIMRTRPGERSSTPGNG